MRTKGVLRIVFLSVCFPLFLQAQNEAKFEMRSAWIPSVYNLDWPKSEHLNNPDEQKADLVRMFDIYENMHMNAVFLQVRPESDALYQSSYEPWSRYFTGQQGTYPGFDPLQFAIAEAHKRGLELHAWVNPFRVNASGSATDNYYHETHVYKQHPEWMMTYEDGSLNYNILNPGLPEVQEYIVNVIIDLISNYPVDGVVFDDYFYRENTSPAMDADAYEVYSDGLDLSDWRRSNVNKTIDTVYKSIQNVNPNIRFGMSPPGVYRPGIPEGISGWDSYNAIYCDALAWLDAGSIDYISPQIYWPTGGNHDFETLASWWKSQAEQNNRHFFASHNISDWSDKNAYENNKSNGCKNFDDLGLSKLENFFVKGTGDPVAEWSIEQVALQIDLIREASDNNSGSVFYSAKYFESRTGLIELLQDSKYTHKAIVPEMTWKSGEIPQAVANIRMITTIEDAYALTWDHTGGQNLRYGIYLSEYSEAVNDIVSDPNNLKIISFSDTVLLSEIPYYQNSKFVITAISAMGKESDPSEIYQPTANFPEVSLLYPLNSQLVNKTDSLVWTSDATNANYLLQIGSNANFSNIIYQSDWMQDSVFNLYNLDLAGEKTFFWRVKAKKDHEGAFANFQEFITGYPQTPVIIAPLPLAQNQAPNLKVKWESSEASSQIKVQISESNSFDLLIADEVFDAQNGEGILQNTLEKNKWYYLRIAAENSFGASPFTSNLSFKTTAGTIPDIVIETPDDNITVASFDALKWYSTVTEGTISYWVEVSLNEDFNETVYQSDWIANQNLAIFELGLPGQNTYYWRAKAKSEFGESEFSDTRSFFTGYPVKPTILSPNNLATDVDVKPIIEWDSDELTDSVCVEFSEKSNFSSVYIRDKFLASASGETLNYSLRGSTSYYMRLNAKNTFGNSLWSSVRTFETGMGNAINFTKIGTEIVVYPTIVENNKLFVKLKKTTRATVILYILNSQGIVVQMLFNGNAADLPKTFKLSESILNSPGLYYVSVQIANDFAVKPLVVH